MYAKMNLLTALLGRMVKVGRSEMKKFMQSLSAGEATRVLKDLPGSGPALMESAYDAAIRVAGDVNADAIMTRVFSRLDNLGVDGLSGRAGRARYGYAGPSDAAWELFEEALDPFIDEMKRSQKRALPAAAKAHCIGILRRLWRYDEEPASDFAGWVEDAPGEFVDSVIEEWKKGDPASGDIDEVMNIAWRDRS